MPLSLNTSDPLYAHLDYLLAVDDDNAVKELVGGLALTVHANVVINNTTAPFGRSFRTGGVSTTPYRITHASVPAPTDAPISVFIACNGWAAKQAGAATTGARLFANNGSLKVGPGIQMYNGGIWQPTSNQSGANVIVPTAGNVATGANSFGFVRYGTSESSPKAFINGALDANYNPAPLDNGTNYSSRSATAEFIGFGGGSTDYVTADWVYVAVFVGYALTDEDFARLHASLTGDNAFALVATSGGGGPDPLEIPGTITVSDITHTEFMASWSAATGGTPPISYELSLDGGATWPFSNGFESYTFSDLTPSTEYQLRLRARDSVDELSAVLSATVTTAAAPVVYPAVTVTEPLKNNTGTLLASQSGISASVLSASTLASVYTATGLTTNASGLLPAISDAALTTGQQYHVAIKLADGGVGITGPITAS